MVQFRPPASAAFINFGRPCSKHGKQRRVRWCLYGFYLDRSTIRLQHLPIIGTKLSPHDDIISGLLHVVVGLVESDISRSLSFWLLSLFRLATVRDSCRRGEHRQIKKGGVTFTHFREDADAKLCSLQQVNSSDVRRHASRSSLNGLRTRECFAVSMRGCNSLTILRGYCGDVTKAGRISKTLEMPPC